MSDEWTEIVNEQVAAAYAEASKHNLRFIDGAIAGCAECDWYIGSGISWASHIRALATAPQVAALERVKAEVRNEALELAAKRADKCAHDCPMGAVHHAKTALRIRELIGKAVPKAAKGGYDDSDY